MNNLERTHRLIRYFRIGRIVLHTLIGLAIAAFAWPLISRQGRQKLTSWWSRHLLACFNVRLITFGHLPDKNTANTMFVANHVSWADIHAFNCVIAPRFIAKSEISSWPVFGYFAKKSGTIFIDRSSRKDAARIVETAANCLRAGDNVGFFPEGTTTNGDTIRPFKSSIIQAALSAKATIIPVAIRYPDNNGKVNILMAYAGDTTLAESIFNVLSQKAPVVELHFLPAINTQGLTRQSITQLAYEQISKVLALHH